MKRGAFSKDLRRVGELAERAYLVDLLREFYGNVSHLAREMDTDRPNLSRLVRYHKIDLTLFRKAK